MDESLRVYQVKLNNTVYYWVIAHTGLEALELVCEEEESAGEEISSTEDWLVQETTKPITLVDEDTGEETDTMSILNKATKAFIVSCSEW